MEFGAFTNPQQGSTHEGLVATAKAAEDLGLHGFYRADHYRALGGIVGSSGDAWISLTALAAETRRIRLGTLMTPATFRHPGAAGDHRLPRRPTEPGMRRLRLQCR